MKGNKFLMDINVFELLKIFIFPIIILIIHIVFAYFDLYRTIDWIDVPMHFLGGVAVGNSYSLLLRKIQYNGYLGSTNNLLFFAFVVSLVAFTAVAWEFLEFVLDLIDNAMRQPSLFNTMQDLFLGIFGGVVGYWLNKFYKH